MKKFLMIAMCASMFYVTTEAQTTYKQSGGAKNLEVNFAPLGGSPISIGGIKYRKFDSTGNKAYRLNVFIGSSSKKEITQQEDAPNYVAELTKKTSGMNISIRPGIEKHMAGTDRLSPYMGAELNLTFNTSKKVEEFENNATTTDVSTYEVTTKGADGYTSIGLGLVSGCDFYFAKSIYLGAEIGFGFNMTSMSDKKTESGQTPSVPSVTENQGSSFQFGPTFISAIRLGWLF